MTASRLYGQEEERFEPVPVMLEGDNLYTVQLKLKNQTPEERAETSVAHLTEFAEDYGTPVDELKIDDTEVSTDIIGNGIVIAIFTSDDADAEGKPRLQLAQEALPRIKAAVLNYRDRHSNEAILRSAGETLLATLLLVASIWLVNVTFRRLILVSTRTLRIQGAAAPTLQSFAKNFLTSIRFFLILILIYFYLHTSLAFFPWTRQLSIQLLGYIIDPLRTIGSQFVHKIPDLLFLCVLTIVIRYVLKFMRLFFYLIETGRFSPSGFYPEWAKPTYRIMRALVIAFALVVAFPYVPGSNTEAFKGISIFVGVLFSLGSTSAISNMIAGMILTYMRPYKLGDWVSIGQTMGVITEMSFLVTRVHTPKNEEIAIANSIVLGQEITNYSNMARENGLIVHTSVTISYSAPWRKVHELLISAALATEWIQPEPAPFVLQTALNDFYVTYQINAYTAIPAQSKNPLDMQTLYSNLHRNMQDKFNDGGVEIMSPHYLQLRDGNDLAIPRSYVPKDHIPGALRILLDGLKKGD